MLAVTAWHEQQLGFLLLEGVWTLVSAWGIVARLRGAGVHAAHQRRAPNAGEPYEPFVGRTGGKTSSPHAEGLRPGSWSVRLMKCAVRIRPRGRVV